MQLPVGLIVDRIGLKKSLCLGTVICATASIGFAFADSYATAAVFRFLTGLGSAFGFVCMLVSVYEWLPKANRAFLIGVSQFIGTMGPMIAAGPFETFASNGSLDWRLLFTYLAVFGFLLSILMLLFVKNNQEKSAQYTILKRPESVGKTIKHLFIRPQAWVIALYCALIYFSIEYLSENEGKAFLIAKGLNPVSASYMITLSWFGYALGCPFFGWLSDFFQRRKFPLVIAAFFGIVGVTGIVYGEHLDVIRLAFLLFGIGSAGQSVGFALMSEQFKKPYLAACLSFNNMVILTSAAIDAPLLSSVIEGKAEHLVPAIEDYQFGLGLLIAFMVGAFVVSFVFIKETYCKSISDFTYLTRSS